MTEEEVKAPQDRVLSKRAATPMLERALAQPAQRSDPQSERVTILLDPIGAPRQSRRDTWKPSDRVKRYRAWKDKFRPACAALGWELKPILRASFFIAMPPSWSKKKRAAMLGQPHMQKPDIDNLCKAVMDAFGKDDGFVWDSHATKRWAEQGSIVLLRT